MNGLTAAGLDYGALADVISAILAIIALVFTLYFWLLDHLSDDETKFLEGKAQTLDQLRGAVDALKAEEEKTRPDLKTILEIVEQTNRRLEVVLNYRFWTRGKQREEYARIREFCYDSRYLVSTLRRFDEGAAPEGGRSAFEISSADLDDKKARQVCVEYAASLTEAVEFFENWN